VNGIIGVAGWLFWLVGPPQRSFERESSVRKSPSVLSRLAVTSELPGALIWIWGFAIVSKQVCVPSMPCDVFSTRVAMGEQNNKITKSLFAVSTNNYSDVYVVDGVCDE